MAVADPEGHYLVTNSAFRQILGPTEQGLRAAFLSDLIEQKEHSGVGSVLTELTKKEAGNLQVEKYYRRQDGSLRWLKVRVSVIRETPTMPRFLLVLVEDITGSR
jgi:PAS domain S-box-containing protein